MMIMKISLRIASIIFSAVVIFASCSSEVKQAQKYYQMGRYEAALNVAKDVLARDEDDVDMAILVWKIQIITQFCDNVKSVEYACSLIREKSAPYGTVILSPLKDALQEEKGCIKLFAVYILGNVDSPEVFPILSEVAGGQIGPLEEGGAITREMIQGGALITLGQRGNTEAYSLMMEAIKSESGELRSMATEALGYIGDENTIPVLEELLNDDYTVGGNRTVAIAASRSLKMITGKDYEIN
jgi:HEAT repeat protein